jgi:hypothetical protein
MKAIILTWFKAVLPCGMGPKGVFKYWMKPIQVSWDGGDLEGFSG